MKLERNTMAGYPRVKMNITVKTSQRQPRISTHMKSRLVREELGIRKKEVVKLAKKAKIRTFKQFEQMKIILMTTATGDSVELYIIHQQDCHKLFRVNSYTQYYKLQSAEVSTSIMPQTFVVYRKEPITCVKMQAELIIFLIFKIENVLITIIKRRFPMV